MGTSIVTVEVSQTVAPTPNGLQKTGAIISQGATDLTPGTYLLLTEPADLTSSLNGSLAISSLAWSGSVVTATTAAPHGFTNADVVKLTIAGATPSGYNGTFQCTITGTSTFTYPLVSNPGMETVPGTYTNSDVAELISQVGTFFAQGAQQAIYVLELGAGTPAEGVTALGAFITASKQFFYAYLVPREWDSETTFKSFLAGFESTTSKTYFFVTSTTGTYTSYTVLMKDVVLWIEAPGIPSTEFSAAAGLYVLLNYAPSTLDQVTPYAFSFLFGVTPYPTTGNAALLTTLKAAFVNIVGTGAEGGISDAIILWGTTKDGRPLNYWYSVDWVQINVNLDVSNEIINGSNNPRAPLFYDQDGINRLQQRAQQTTNRGVSFGLILPPVVVTAVPFSAYVKANPSDYPAGVYNGLAVTYTPQRGFTSITFIVNVTDFPTG